MREYVPDGRAVDVEPIILRMVARESDTVADAGLATLSATASSINERARLAPMRSVLRVRGTARSELDNHTATTGMLPDVVHATVTDDSDMKSVLHTT